MALYNCFSRGRAPGKSHDSYINRSKCTLIFTISSFRRSKGNRRKGEYETKYLYYQGKSVNLCIKPNCTVKGCITASTILKKLYYYSMRSMPNIIFILKKSSQAISFRLQRLVLFKILLAPPWGFPWGSDGKESTCNAGDLGLLPGWGRSPGEGKGNPLQ